MSFELVDKFENLISNFFGSKYGIATDSCTHAIELCLRYKNIKKVSFPKRTYLSVPMLGVKLDLDWDWNNDEWKDYYILKNTNIIDAAVLWKEGSYIQNTFMCLSFQYQKHLNIGRGGMILTDDKDAYSSLLKMSYDGRVRNRVWRSQDIDTIGYHYYLTPENAQRGIDIFKKKFNIQPKLWNYLDYPNLSKMKIFNK